MSTEFQEDKKPLNAVQYAAKDYPTYFDSILARLRENYGDDYDDFASTSVGIMLVNLMAYGLSQLSWYLDRRSSESYLATARTLDSVTRLASQIGYKPKRASAASVDLSITFPALAADTIMSKGFKFDGPGGLTYQVMTDVSLTAGQTAANVTVSEGEQRTQTFTSSGAPSQVFLIPSVLSGEYVADQSVRVYVNGLEWSESDFIVYERTNQFAVSYTTDPPRVVFGDGSAGNIPDQGADIRIDYRVIRAEAGNVRSNTIQKAVDSLIVAGDIVSITTVTNPTPATGGSGPQSISEIKKVAPLAYQAGGSAVTQQDYYAIVNSFSDPVYGSIAKGYAAVTRAASLDVYTTERLDGIDAVAQEVISTADRIQTDAVANMTEARAEIDKIEDNTDIAGAAFADARSSSTTIAAYARQCTDYALTASGNLDGITSIMTDLTVLVAADPFDANAAVELVNRAKALAISAKTSVDNTASITGTGISGESSLITTACNSGISATQEIADAYRAARVDLINTTTNIFSWNILARGQDEAIRALTAELRPHLDSLFDDSCKANVVTVPILVEGREGFYGAPSAGLLRALQSHLNEVKEVTHLVKVVSGVSALKPADITLRIRYDERYVVAEVRAEINSGIDALLRRRDFGKSLYVSDLYSIIELIDGVSYVNITITNPANRIDLNGNLVVGELEVVTKGTITIVEV
jgi:hypothetical protein